MMGIGTNTRKPAAGSWAGKEYERDVCGRYYVDDETAREIERIAGNIDEKLKFGNSGDIRPSGNGVVLRMQNIRSWSCSEKR